MHSTHTYLVYTIIFVCNIILIEIYYIIFYILYNFRNKLLERERR